VDTAKKEGVHCIGLSILSGSHVTLAHEVMRLMTEEGVSAPLVVGGIIPPADEKLLLEAGVSAVYTPKNYDLNLIMTDLARIIENSVEKVA
jgi:ethylmalonyl-CoA mutase